LGYTRVNEAYQPLDPTEYTSDLFSLFFFTGRGGEGTTTGDGGWLTTTPLGWILGCLDVTQGLTEEVVVVGVLVCWSDSEEGVGWWVRVGIE